MLIETPYKQLLAVVLTLISVLPVQAAKWSGNVTSEYRYFPRNPVDPRQHGNNLSISMQTEYYQEWDKGRQSLTVTPFLRIDENDSQRSHFDLREFTWVKASNTWELRIGMRKVFWGVAESQHLVDIINQTDLVENLDQEDKLGQAMINLALIRNWGTVDLFVLPGFRERTFPGIGGRLRTPLPIDSSQSRYASSRGKKRVDVAVRWSHTLGDWDLGLYHFTGTSREPRLIPGRNARGEPVLIPLYEVIDQTGLDIQATKGNWLWKLEAISRSGQEKRFQAAVGGFEYTFYGLAHSPKDLGLVAEYHYDSRGSTAPTPFQDDLMLGLRLTWNDAQSTEALIGVIVDRQSRARFYNIEASRRIGKRFKLTLEGRAFVAIPANDPLFSIRDDDYMQVELAYYF